MTRAIENGFPITFVSLLAEHESWRKEVYRPPYYIHKWWARRLGSVFRAIILSSCVRDHEDVEHLFYEPVRFPDITVFDPFMGSGTTVGEAVKLGCRAIGRDINPVAVGLVATALQQYSREAVLQTYQYLYDSVGRKIQAFYRTTLHSGEPADILYYFWVKTVPCPQCDALVELFSSRVFATHAAPSRHPEAKAICPGCGAVNDVRFDARAAKCHRCDSTYNPQMGTVSKGRVTCPSCHAESKTIDAVRCMDGPPDHRMYAKLVLAPGGQKVYLSVDESDLEAYEQARDTLDHLWDNIPFEPILPGYNTDQVLNYNYRYWSQMFNARQLAGIALLVSEIRKIADPRLRMLFAYLLSGTLEFNNMFCSYKGEGTGAVRHMFSHHILKPELMPIEANLWGTPKSSGSFSTLFQSRILRALDYKAAPSELRLVKGNGRPEGQKLHALGCPMNAEIAPTYEAFSSGNSVYLSCGDSSHTDIPDGSVDLVITDPPFFDNVHYSQLADFFHIWLRKMLDGQTYFRERTTRSEHEVQDTEAQRFTDKLTSVLTECHRVLRDSGLLALTYHHSRAEGWASVYRAIREAGFQIVLTHPVKSEMAVAIPIQQASMPVNFDLILVCRKGNAQSQRTDSDRISLRSCADEAREVIETLRSAQLIVSLGDAKVIFMGRILARLSVLNDISAEVAAIYDLEPEAERLARGLAGETRPEASASAAPLAKTKGERYEQLPLLTSG